MDPEPTGTCAGPLIRKKPVPAKPRLVFDLQPVPVGTILKHEIEVTWFDDRAKMTHSKCIGGLPLNLSVMRRYFFNNPTIRSLILWVQHTVELQYY